MTNQPIAGRPISAMPHFDDLLRVIAERDLDPDEFCIVGSACLWIRHIRENRDIDISVYPSRRSELIVSRARAESASAVG